PVDADVNDGGTGPYHVGRDKAWPADGSNKDIGLARDRAKIACFGMINRNGSVFMEQQHRDRLADDVAAADNHSVLPADRQAAALEDFDDTRWSAWSQCRATRLQLARVDGMKAVHILRGKYGVEQGLGIDLLRKWKLDQDAVDVIAVVEAM